MSAEAGESVRTPGARLRTRWRWAFFVFAFALTTATHWPNLRIESGVIDRPDLLLHATSFAALTVLILLSRFFATEALAWRNLLAALALALAWAGLDEISQALPGLNRTVAWSDFLANCLGVALVGCVCCVWRVQKGATGAN